MLFGNNNVRTSKRVYFSIMVFSKHSSVLAETLEHKCIALHQHYKSRHKHFTITVGQL